MENVLQQAVAIFDHAVAAVQPQQFMRKALSSLDVSGASRIFLLGAGKAAASMAFEAEQILGSRIAQGLVVTNHLPGYTLQKTTVLTAAHPVPDLNSLIAGTAMLNMASAMQPGDLVIFLLSGGASSLLADVPEGATMEELQELFNALLKSGADIREMNTVRKHLSSIKGGQLARTLQPADVFSIILSDVPGDDPAVIGSGPTVADPSTFTEAWIVLEKYGLAGSLPEGILQHIKNGIAGAVPETPKPGELHHSDYMIAASNGIALEAAADKARALGYHTRILTGAATGEAGELAVSLADLALNYEGPYPACLLAGGETTVKVTGNGLGGRNQELALATGLLLKNAPHITFLSAGTDGIDGPTDAAGAVINAAVLANAPDPQPFLARNDCWHFFDQAGTHIKPGHTGTNVMDVMVLLLQKP
jgi:hydroxypyruvate reductase